MAFKDGRIYVAFSRAFDETYSVDDERLGQYSPKNQVWYSYARLRRLLEREGLAARTVEKLSASDLDGCRVLVIARPNREVSSDSRKAIRTFMNDGGSVLLIENYLSDNRRPMGTDRLAAEWGVDLIPLQDLGGVSHPQPVADAIDFCLHFLDGFDSTHPVSAGVKRVAMHETCGLVARGKRASKVAWGSLHTGLVAGHHGEGRFAVLADTEVFNDLLLGLFDNERFALNLFRWLAYRVDGTDAIDRLTRVLAAERDIQDRLDPLTHIGPQALSPAASDGPLAERIFRLVASFDPRNVLRSLFTSAGLVELEKNVSGSCPPAPDDLRIDRILHNLGFHLPPRSFGRPVYRSEFEAHLAALEDAQDITRCTGACLGALQVFELMTRDLVSGYGALLFPNASHPLAELLKDPPREGRESMGAWHQAALAVTRRLHANRDQVSSWPGIRDLDWKLVHESLDSDGGQMTRLRNRLAHPRAEDRHRLVEPIRSFLLDGGRALVERCVAALPEIVRIKSVNFDSLGQKVVISCSDEGQERRLLTSDNLSTAVTYFHFARTPAPVSINPFLVQRSWP